MECVFPVVVLVALLLACFWIYTFVQVMLLSDEDFPGRYDKVLWVIAFLLMAALAPFAFVFWKSAYLAMRQAERSEGKG
jgi:hypothetical protein